MNANLRRALDLCLFAALLLGITEAGSALAGGGFGIMASLEVLAVAAVAGAVIAVPVAGVAWLSAWPRLTANLRGRWFGAASALVLMLPPLGALLRVGFSLAVAPVLLMLVALGVGAGAFRIGTRSARGLGWLVGCVAAMQLADATADSVNLAARIRPDGVDAMLALATGLFLGTLAVAAVVARAIGAVGGWHVPRPVLAGASIALAVGLAAAAANVDQGSYLTPRIAAFSLAFACAVLGGAAFTPRMPGRVLMLALVPALGLLAHLRITASPLNATAWQLASRTTVAGELLRATGFLSSGFEGLRESLAATPAAADGASAQARANAWNAEWAEREVSEHPDQSVVLITVDTLRYDHLGYSGLAPAGLTPALDRLAEGSTRFHRAYAQGGWTSLSIPSLMWSRHPEHIQFTRVFEDAWFALHFEDEVDATTSFPRAFQSPRTEPGPNLAETLSRAGLSTLAVTNDGFTHYFEPRIGLVRGFEDIVYPRAAVAARAASPDEVPFEISDAATVDLALELLRKHAGERVFLWVHLFGPHEPYVRWPDAKAEWSAYASEVHQVDHEIGRLLGGVRESGHGDGVTIMVTGDHGEALGEHGSSGHGLQAYEPSIHVPLLVATGDGEGEGRDVHEAVGLIDLAPTIVHRLGAPAPTSFEGFDLAPWLRGDASDRPPVLSETWRVPVRGDTRDPHLLSVIDGTSKVVVDLRHATLAFFDLETDPDERDNLASSVDASRREAYLRLAAFALGVHDAAR